MANDENDKPGANDHKPEGLAGETLAHRIWQAGLGAYGRALGDAAGNMAKLSGETSKMFEDLAKKGEALEEASHKGENAPIRRTLFDRPPIEERLSHLKAAFGFTRPLADNDDHPVSGAAGDILSDPDDARIAALEAKVADLKAQLDALEDSGGDGNSRDNGDKDGS